MTRKYLAILTFLLLLLALSYGIYRIFKPTLPQPQPPTPSQSNQQPSKPEISADWKTYKDDVYGFTLSYPKDWEAEATHLQWPEDPPDLLRYRYEFSDGKTGFVIVTDLLPEGKSLHEWLADNKPPEPLLDIPEKENAVLGGLLAYVLLIPETRNSPPAFWAFWIHKGYVFWLRGSLPTQTFTKILENLRFEGVEASLVTTKLPELPELKLWK